MYALHRETGPRVAQAGRLCGLPARARTQCHQGLCSMHKLLYGLILLVAAAVAGWLVVLDRQGRLVWDHWDEVKRGVLYRSGQLTPEQLTDAVKRYNLRTVINLQ